MPSTAKERSAAAPDIPTAAEAGFPMEVSIWHGLWAPKGTPPEIIARLNAAAVAALKDPDDPPQAWRISARTSRRPSEMQPAAFAAFQQAPSSPLEADHRQAPNVKVE